MKTFVAVVAGFLAWTVLFLGSNAIILRVFPTSFKPDGSTDSVGMLFGLLVSSMVYSVISGWVTAKMAATKGLVATLALGVTLLAVGIAVQLQYWDVMPLWYHLIFLGALIPSVLVGYRLKQ